MDESYLLTRGQKSLAFGDIVFSLALTILLLIIPDRILFLQSDVGIKRLSAIAFFAIIAAIAQFSVACHIVLKSDLRRTKGERFPVDYTAVSILSTVLYASAVACGFIVIYRITGGLSGVAG